MAKPASSNLREVAFVSHHLAVLLAVQQKTERYNRTVNSDFKSRCPTNLDEARKLVQRFVEHYNRYRLHSAVVYVAPFDLLSGHAQDIWDARDRKLEAARETHR